MMAYRCLAAGADGIASWRVIRASSERNAVDVILAEGLTPIEVRAGDRLSILDRLNQPVRLGWRLSLADQALLLSQLALLVRAGLPVDRSIDLLRDQAVRAAARTSLKQVLDSVRAGETLATALDNTGIFPDFVIGVVRSSEKGGRLSEALRSIADRLTRASAVRRQLVTALTYPAAVLAATMIALLIVLTLVVPQFAPIFEGQEAKLPTLTRMVLAASDAVAQYGWWILFASATLIAAATLAWRSSLRSGLSLGFRSRIPGIELRDQYVSGQLLGLFATLLSNGVNLVQAITLLRGSAPAGAWRGYLDVAERRVREGSTLSRALAVKPLLPATALRLIEVGERTGQLAETCAQASEILAQSARAKIERIVSLVNPVAIVGLGGLVASLVAGVMLGIFALGDFTG